MSATAKDGLVKNLTIHEPNKHVVRFHLFLKKNVFVYKRMITLSHILRTKWVERVVLVSTRRRGDVTTMVMDMGMVV